MSWWYYATGTEKALVIVGVIALALLAIIIASPYVKPLQAVTAKLGLVRTETVYVPVPVNHTVVKYVNQTVVKYVYVNQTVPVYINRTIYVPVPSNASGSVVWPIETGACHIYSLYFLSNGTMWTLGYWIPPPQIWRLVVGWNGTVFTWLVLGSAKPYGEELSSEYTFYIIIPGEYPDIGKVVLPMFAVVPKQAPANWTYMIYLGDWFGFGPVVRNFVFITNNSIVMEATPYNVWPYNVSVATLPLENGTTEVLLIPFTTQGAPMLVLPCNWTIVVTSMTPQQALTLPAPMGEVIAEEAAYVYTGNYTYALYGPTWGFWVWNTTYPMQNVANLPWPVG